VEEVLYSTALCLDDPTCGGGPCPEPNNVFGHGRIDAFQAVSMALGNPPQVDLPWMSEAPISGIITVSESIAIQVTFYAAGLSGGEYTGFLGILSSDPTTPFTSVPVTLNVIILVGPSQACAELSP
jgi:hypothetical protein